MGMSYVRLEQLLKDLNITVSELSGAVTGVAAAAAVAPIATADATDPATTMALANECKAKLNELIAALGT